MGQDIRVLMVDDDHIDLELNRRLLSDDKRMRFVVETVDNLTQAVQSLRTHTYDVLLLDLNLLESIGLATLAEIRRENGDIPIIVVSGLSDEETALQSLDQGAQDYLVKGKITTDMLVNSIRYSIQRQQLLGEITNSNKLLEIKSERMLELYKTAHRFVDNVSHEFRTPLTVIKEYTSLIREGLIGELNSEQEQMLDVVSDRADDLNNMVDDMLDVSKLESGNLGIWGKKCSVTDIIEHIRPSLQKKSSIREVEIDFDVPTNLPEVYCDDEKIGRVIINLATNAIKFSGQPGKVLVFAHANVLDRELVIGVTDNGAGISEENLQSIFQRFKQVGRNPHGITKGFGLGLNIAKELVDLNYGEITVESLSGQGSTFSFTIPFADPVEVVRRYIRSCQRLHNGPCMVSLLKVSAPRLTDVVAVKDVDAFLNLALRRNDLVFPLDDGQWLLALPGTRGDLPQVVDRVNQMRVEANQNRPRGQLPVLNMELIETWDVNQDADEMLARLEQEMKIPENVHV